MGLSTKKLIDRIIGFSMATWVNCLLTFIATPIVTTFFNPDELGRIEMFVSYANIITPFTYMGFDQAFARFYNEPPSKNSPVSIGKICLRISSCCFLIVALVLFVMRDFFSNKILGYSYAPLIVGLIAYVFSDYILRYSELNARMQNKVLSYSIQSILVTFTVKISFVLVVIVETSVEKAIMFRACLYFVIALIFLANFVIRGRNDHPHLDSETAKTLTTYAVPIVPTIFLLNFTNSLPMFMIENFGSYSDVGIYSNAVRIASMIVVIQAGLTVFWAPFVYEYYKTEQKKLQTMHHVISFCVLGFGFLLILFQFPIYKILVDTKYWQSREIFALLILSPVCITISETLGIGIDISKKTYLKTPPYIASIAVNFLLGYLLIPKYGIYGAAIATGFASIVMLVFKAALGNKYYKCSDNYLKLALGISAFTAAGFINIFFTGFVKYGLITAIMLLFIVIYLNEAKTIMKEGSRYLMNAIHKG